LLIKPSEIGQHNPEKDEWEGLCRQIEPTYLTEDAGTFLHSYGRKIYSSGPKLYYQGFFKRMLFNGRGKLVYTNGISKEGLWKNGEFIQ